jgi:hypothetical protein
VKNCISTTRERKKERKTTQKNERERDEETRNIQERKKNELNFNSVVSVFLLCSYNNS